MNIEILVHPTQEPLSLADVYGHLRLDPEGSPPEHPLDSLLRAHIVAARQMVEQHTRRSLCEQTLRLSRACFETYDQSAICYRPFFELLRPPLISVESVQYYDVDNTLQTIDPVNYFVSADLVARLYFKSSYTLPLTYSRSDAVQVTYKTGYHAYGGSPIESSAADVPEALKSAMKLHVQMLYDELMPDEQVRVLDAIESILSPYRVHTY